MSFQSLFVEPSVKVATVPTFAQLPSAVVSGVGAERVTADTGTLYISDGASWNSAGGGGSGIVSINGNTSSAQTIAAGSGIDVASSLGTTTISLTAGSNNTLSYYNATGELVTFPGWGVDPTYFGLNVGVTQNVIDDGYHNWNYLNLVLEPSIASPSTTWVHEGKQISIDTSLSGFAIGTNGQAALFDNMYYSHLGTSDTGSLWYTTMAANIGNGTDPITVGGMQGQVFFPAIDENVTFSNQMIGYSFGPSAAASAVFSVGVVAFQDTPQFLGAVSGYTTFNSAPQIASIENNANYAGINLNPSITTMTGNAGATMIGLAGTITNMGTSGFRGLSLSTNLVNLTDNSSGLQVNAQSTSGDADWSALDVNTQNINTTGIVRGLQIQTDVSLSTQAIESSGHHNLSCNFDIVDGLGQVYGNVIGGQVNVPDGVAITGSDVLANNMAFTINTGNATSSFTAASVVGITPLGFVGQIIGDGDVTGGINFCLDGYSFAANTGTIDRIVNFHAAAIPGGGTATVNETILFYGQQPFGFVGTDNWGIRLDTEGLQNYMTCLAVGDMASKKVANASVGLELDSVTKAFLNARMTTTERNALTAVNGMQIYNVTDDKLQVYAAGSWVDLH